LTKNAIIPLNDLGRGTRALRPEIDAAIARVLDRGYYVLGPENAALALELSTYLGAESVLVGNGTDALQLALCAVGVGAGDGVVTVANAGGYTSTAVRSLGATAIYADVERENLLASLATIEASIATVSAPPKAIVLTHLYGSSVEAAPIVAFARENGIFVIEDCAQALGATQHGQKVGTFGDVATTSFYPTKNLGAVGDGGAVMSKNPEIADRVRRLRQYGWSTKYTTTDDGGMNSRLDEIQAAVLRVKLPLLDFWNDRRRSIHQSYSASIGKGARLVSSPLPGFVGHLAVVDTDDRERAIALFAESSIATETHYPIPDHQQPLLIGSSQPELPETERSAGRIFSVPLFPELTDREIERISTALGAL
jgi:aminotransferase EvaB